MPDRRSPPDRPRRAPRVERRLEHRRPPLALSAHTTAAPHKAVNARATADDHGSRSLGESAAASRERGAIIGRWIPALTPASGSGSAVICSCPKSARHGQRRLKQARVLCVGAGGPRLAGRAVPRGRRRRHHRPSSTSTSSTSAICSGKSSTALRTSADRNSTRRRRGSSAESRRPRRNLRRALLERQRARHSSRPSTSILDGTDNFAARYLVNDACVLYGGPTRGAASSGSKGRHPSSPLRADPATAACTPSRRLPGSCRAAPRPACSACCPGSSAPSRRPRR